MQGRGDVFTTGKLHVTFLLSTGMQLARTLGLKRRFKTFKRENCNEMKIIKDQLPKIQFRLSFRPRSHEAG